MESENMAILPNDSSLFEDAHQRAGWTWFNQQGKGWSDFEDVDNIGSCVNNMNAEE